MPIKPANAARNPLEIDKSLAFTSYTVRREISFTEIFVGCKIGITTSHGNVLVWCFFLITARLERII